MTKAIATKEETAIAVHDYGDDAGKGYEGQTQDEIIIPRLAILQPMSPQCQDDGIEGAKAGMLCNTVTEDVMDEAYCVFGHKDYMYVEWVPRERGGGFVGTHAVDSEIVKRAKRASDTFGKYKTDDDNDLVETFNAYGVLTDKDAEIICPFAMSFKSTGIRPWKGWVTTVSMFTLPGSKATPPLFAHRVKLTTTKQKNDKGTFYVPVFKPACDKILDSLLGPDHPTFLQAKKWGLMVQKGEAKASEETDSGNQSEEIPF